MPKLEFKCIEKITREHIFNDASDPVIQVRFGVSEQPPFGPQTPGVEFSAWMIKTVADQYEVGRYYQFVSSPKPDYSRDGEGRAASGTAAEGS